MRHHGGINLHPAALHLAIQQGAHLVTEAPMMGKFCSRVLALLPDWHVAKLLEGGCPMAQLQRALCWKKAIGSYVCTYAFETSFHFF